MTHSVLLFGGILRRRRRVQDALGKEQRLEDPTRFSHPAVFRPRST
jgi:hypothetical protein